MVIHMLQQQVRLAQNTKSLAQYTKISQQRKVHPKPIVSNLKIKHMLSILVTCSNYTSQSILYGAYVPTAENFKQSLKQLLTVVIHVRGENSH